MRRPCAVAASSPQLGPDELLYPRGGKADLTAGEPNGERERPRLPIEGVLSDPEPVRGLLDGQQSVGIRRRSLAGPGSSSRSSPGRIRPAEESASGLAVASGLSSYVLASGSVLAKSRGLRWDRRSRA
jgi:hypothetical protein